MCKECLKLSEPPALKNSAPEDKAFFEDDAKDTVPPPMLDTTNLTPTEVLQVLSLPMTEDTTPFVVYAVRAMEHAVDYLNGIDITHNTRFTALIMDVVVAPPPPPPPLISPQGVIKSAVADTGTEISSTWADAILGSAEYYLQTNITSSNDDYNTKKFFALVDTELYLWPPAIYPANVLINAMNDTGSDKASRWADGIINNVLQYLDSGGLYSRDDTHNTTAFFDLIDTSSDALNKSMIAPPPVEPAEQLGMLGREDGLLTPLELALDIDTDEEVEMVKCCDGDGECEHPEDEDDDCDCEKCCCGCVVDNENEYKCSNCESCEECCRNSNNCFHCEKCEETRSSDNQCEKCDLCNDCCQQAADCWVCSGCEKTKQQSKDQYSCELCECCDNCCECQNCDACSEKHSCDIMMCLNCSSCYEYCECTDCRCCGVSEDDRGELVGFCTKCHYCDSCGHHKYCPNKPKPGKITVPAPTAKQYATIESYASPFGNTTYDNVMPAYYAPTTQKAKGLTALRDGLSGILNVPNFTIISAKGATAEQIVGRFVRPCPETPRHGFVDSRKIVDLEQATAVLAETLAADPMAEFILMDEIAAEFSGIWTPGLMVMGPRNDGATAGHGSVTIPVAGQFINATYDECRNTLYSRSGIKQAPYLELLWTPMITSSKPAYYRMSVVQLRDGPQVPQQVNYITAAMEVEHIIEAGGDLLEWETKMKEQPAGTVVHHPGGSLASHYAVHAILNNIPVMISRKPKVGDVLVPTEDGEAQPNIEAMRQGFYYGMTTPCDYRAALYMALLGVHSTVLWLGKKDVLLGAALGFAYRLTLTACLGEWRHRPNAHNVVKWDRESVYKTVFFKADKIHGLYMRALKDFRQQTWGESMGGERWFQFTQWGAVIYNAVLDGDMKAALAAMNNVVNAAHNNGWGFNKFADNGTLNTVAADPASALIQCAPLAYKALAAGNAMDHSVLDFKVARWLSTARRYRVEQFKQWITDPKYVPKIQSAKYIQLKVVDETTVLAEFRNGGNSVLHGEETFKLDKLVVSQLKDVMQLAKADGRLMKTFAPNDDGSIDGRDHASTPAEQQFLAFNRYQGNKMHTLNNTAGQAFWIDMNLATPVTPIPASKETL